MKGKQKSKVDRLIVLAMIACGLILAYCAFRIISTYMESWQNRKANEKTAQLYRQMPEAGQDQAAIDFAALQKINPEVIGWIQMPGIEEINVPVVQAKDDTKYLRKTWDGKSSRYGAIFMEWQNNPDFNDAHTILYGHSMKDGSMFGRLMDFEEKNFWEQTGGEIIIDLPQETRRYTIFSVEYVNPDEKDVYTIGFVPGEEFEQFVNRLIARSLYEIPVTVAKNSHILTLSTCAEDGRIRFVVHAVQTEGSEV